MSNRIDVAGPIVMLVIIVLYLVLPASWVRSDGPTWALITGTWVVNSLIGRLTR